MRPLLTAWLEEQGLPGWLSPGYAAMVGLGAVIAAAIVLGATARERDDVRGVASTLLVGYAAALTGGYVYELLRVAPAAIAQLSLHPFAHVGRAAYGGLLFATLATGLHLRYRGAPLGPFFDRVAVGLGVVYALVRTGCLLEGCDYGVPTGGSLGVSYPPSSLAAMEHLHRGWTAIGDRSLPTHPTQLYEGAVAMVGSGVAVLVRRAVLRRRAASGSAFLAWLLVYAAGRFAVEVLRADADRGVYVGLSTAQWTSLCVGGAAALALLRGRGRPESRWTWDERAG